MARSCARGRRALSNRDRNRYLSRHRTHRRTGGVDRRQRAPRRRRAAPDAHAQQGLEHGAGERGRAAHMATGRGSDPAGSTVAPAAPRARAARQNGSPAARCSGPHRSRSAGARRDCRCRGSRATGGVVHGGRAGALCAAPRKSGNAGARARGWCCIARQSRDRQDATIVKERLTTLACAVGALLLFGAMFLRGEARLAPADEPPRPTSAERRADGHYAAFEWLRSERIPAHSWRDRYQRLLDEKRLPAPVGNLLLLTLPASVSIRSEEFLSLASWVRAGNTLLVLAALSDRPAWANTPAGLTAADLSLLTGLEFETSSPRDATTGLRTFAEPRRAVLVPNRSHAYFEGVQSAVALSDAPAPTWAVKVPYDGFVLALARERSSGDEVFWTRPLGEGL